MGTIPALIPVASELKTLIKIVRERVYSGISETNNIAALATSNAGIERNTQTKKPPRRAAVTLIRSPLPRVCAGRASGAHLRELAGEAGRIPRAPGDGRRTWDFVAGELLPRPPAVPAHTRARRVVRELKPVSHENLHTLRSHGLVTVTSGMEGPHYVSVFSGTLQTGRGLRRSREPPAPDRLPIGAPDQLAGREHVRTVADGGVPGHEAAHYEEDALDGGGEAGDLPEAGFEQGEAVDLPRLHAAGRHAGDGAARGHVQADGGIRADDVEDVGGEIYDDDFH